MGWLAEQFDRLTGADQRARRRVVSALSNAPGVSRQRIDRVADRLGVPAPPESAERRWEAAKGNRLNQAHWASVSGQPINAELNAWLTNLRHRCEYEVANNSLVEGMVNTYQLCCVGSEAPALALSTEDEAYAKARSRVWDEWASTAGSNQQLSLVEILHLWIRSLFGSGEFFCQLISVPDASPISLRLLPIHAYRCFTPPFMIGIPEIALGVKRDVKNRRPLSYYISQPWIYQAYEVYTGQFDEIPYRDMVHGYWLTEPDQVRGVPWIASCLEPIAQLRDFKTETLDAARAAADWAVVLTTQHPDSPFFQVNETTDIERRTIRSMPPGWDAKQMSPAHPGPQFVPFYEAIAREIGGPIAMPLMMLLLDSSSSNYSSARFDGQMFWRGVSKTQGWLGRILARIESLVAREAELLGMLPAPPADLMRQFVWPKAPHVDPVKEATAEEMALRNGSMSYTQLCAAQGVSVERMIAMRKRDNELLRAAGLPEIPGIDSAAQTAEINAQGNSGTQDATAERMTPDMPDAPRRRFRSVLEGINGN